MRVVPKHAESAVPPAVQTHAQTLEKGCSSLTLKGISHPFLQVLDGFLITFPPTSPPPEVPSPFPRMCCKYILHHHSFSSAPFRALPV